MKWDATSANGSARSRSSAGNSNFYVENRTSSRRFTQLQSELMLHMLHTTSLILHVSRHKRAPPKALGCFLFSHSARQTIHNNHPISMICLNSVSRDEDPSTFWPIVPHDPIDGICTAIVQARTFNALAPAANRLLHSVYKRFIPSRCFPYSYCRECPCLALCGRWVLSAAARTLLRWCWLFLLLLGGWGLGSWPHPLVLDAARTLLLWGWRHLILTLATSRQLATRC